MIINDLISRDADEYSTNDSEDLRVISEGFDCWSKVITPDIKAGLPA